MTDHATQQAANALPAVLITGASSGIGAVYADHFAKRGHALVLTGRDTARLDALAARLRAETGVAVDVITADLTEAADLARVEDRLRSDATIGVLVNNAGMAAPGSFSDPDLEATDRLIRLNVTALTRLAGAVVPRFVAQGSGAIVNVASILALIPEFAMGAYPATKAYVLAFSQTLQAELGPKGVYVQAVMPGGTRTEIWQRSDRRVEDVPGLMEVDAMVDAAMAGFDLREPVTFPSLGDVGKWQALDAQRQALAPALVNGEPAERYRAA